MDKILKQELWKIFNVAAFLFITIFFILPYLIQISTFYHEKAHQKILNKYHVENSYQMNLLETIPNFLDPNVDKLGVTKFDLNAYKALGKFQKTEINIAGIVSDLKFLFLIGIYLALANIYIFYKVRMKKEMDLTGVLSINWILFMWLIALVQITISNITYSSGDVYSLVRFLGM